MTYNQDDKTLSSLINNCHQSNEDPVEKLRQVVDYLFTDNKYEDVRGHDQFRKFLELIEHLSTEVKSEMYKLQTYKSENTEKAKQMQLIQEELFHLES